MGNGYRSPQHGASDLDAPVANPNDEYQMTKEIRTRTPFGAAGGSRDRDRPGRLTIDTHQIPNRSGCDGTQSHFSAGDKSFGMRAQDRPRKCLVKTD